MCRSSCLCRLRIWQPRCGLWVSSPAVILLSLIRETCRICRCVGARGTVLGLCLTTLYVRGSRRGPRRGRISGLSSGGARSRLGRWPGEGWRWWMLGLWGLELRFVVVRTTWRWREVVSSVDEVVSGLSCLLSSRKTPGVGNRVRG